MTFVLLVQNDRVVAYLPGRGQPGKSATFSKGDKGFDRFFRFLKSQCKDDFIVLLDLDSEQIHQQKIPAVGRSDQKSLLLHHRRKLFGDSPYSSGRAYKQTKQRDSKTDTTFIGIPSANAANEWLATLDRAEACIRSFHWMTLLVWPLVRSMVDSAVVLVLVRLRYGDDRIVVYKSAQLLISRRLSQDTAGVTESDGKELAGQVRQTVGYLERIPEFTEIGASVADELSVIGIGNYSEAEITAVDEELTGMGVRPLLEHTTVPQSRHNRFASGIGMRGGATANSVCTTELISVSVRRREARSFSLISSGERFLQKRVRHIMYALSLSFLTCAAVATGAARYVSDDLKKLQHVAGEIELSAMQWQQTNPLPDLNGESSIASIRESMLHVAAIRSANKTTPFHFIISLAEQLTRHTEIKLTSISWVDARPDAAEWKSAQAKKNTLTEAGVKPEVGSLETEIAHALVTDASAAGTLYSEIGNLPDKYSATVAGYVVLDSVKPALAMSQFKSFVASIRQSLDATEVTIVELPFAAENAHRVTSERGAFILEINSRANAK